MKIKTFSAQTATSLGVQTIHFTTPTLLVGLSGAGKSQLLTYLYETCQLLCGAAQTPLPDGSYRLEFCHCGQDYDFLATVKNGETLDPSVRCGGNAVSFQTLKRLDLAGFLYQSKNISQIRRYPQTPECLLLSWWQQEELKSLYRFIFQDISDIRFDSLRFWQEGTGWLTPQDLSDGMLKTFAYLKDLISAPKDSIIFIDEFENGLGPNCLSILLEEMLARSDLQLILSSHHPYVINNIPPENWLIISRQQDQISARKAADLGIGQTRYDAFFELMNSLYNEGDL